MAGWEVVRVEELKTNKWKPQAYKEFYEQLGRVRGRNQAGCRVFLKGKRKKTFQKYPMIHFFSLILRQDQNPFPAKHPQRHVVARCPGWDMGPWLVLFSLFSRNLKIREVAKASERETKKTAEVRRNLAPGCLRLGGTDQASGKEWGGPGQHVRTPMAKSTAHLLADTMLVPTYPQSPMGRSLSWPAEWMHP